MPKQYPFNKANIRAEMSDLRIILRCIEVALRSNDYTHWDNLSLDVVAIAISVQEKMKGK